MNHLALRRHRAPLATIRQAASSLFAKPAINAYYANGLIDDGEMFEEGVPIEVVIVLQDETDGPDESASNLFSQALQNEESIVYMIVQKMFGDAVSRLVVTVETSSVPQRPFLAPE